MKKNYIFISYSHKDSNKVMSIVNQLARNYRVKYDNSIGASSEYNDVIAEMISGSNIMLAFISANYTDSSYCMDELLYARSKEIPVLMIYLEDTALPAGVEMRVGRFQSVWVKDEFYMSKIQEIEEVKQCSLGANESSAAFMNSASTSKRRKPKKKLSSMASAMIVIVITIIVTLGLIYGLVKVAGIDPSKLFDKTVAENQSGYQGENEEVQGGEQEDAEGDIQLADKEETREPQIDEPQMSEPEETTQSKSKRMETSKTLVNEMYSGAVCADGTIVWVERNKNDYVLKTSDGSEKELKDIHCAYGVKCVYNPYSQELYFFAFGDDLNVYEVDEELNYTCVASLNYMATSQGRSHPITFFSDDVMVLSQYRVLIDTNLWETVGSVPDYSYVINDLLYQFDSDYLRGDVAGVWDGFYAIDFSGERVSAHLFSDAEMIAITAFEGEEQIYCDGRYAYFLGAKGGKDYVFRFDGVDYEPILCLNDYRYYQRFSYAYLVVTDNVVRCYDTTNKVFKEFER